MRNRVISIVFTSENNALVFGSAQYCRVLNHAGYKAEIIDLHFPEQIKHMTALLRSGEVAFAFGLQGVGSHLEVQNKQNLWTVARTPFVALHYDHPSYNPNNHENPSPYVSNLYVNDSFLNTKLRYLPSNQLSGSMPFALLSETNECKTRYEDRAIKYLYLKTGYSLEKTDAFIGQAPARIAEAIRSQLSLMRKNPNLLIADLACEIFDHFGLDRTEYKTEFWNTVYIMDRHIRSQRAIDFVNWLKHQEGAVIIGNGWDSIDKDGAKAVFKPPVDAVEATKLYSCAKYICNTNPYGEDMIHERAVSGLVCGCGVISDSNAWWDRSFANEPAVSLFSWDKPLDDQLLPVMQRPDSLSIEANRTGRNAAYRIFSISGVAPLVRFAQRTRQFGDQATSK